MDEPTMKIKYMKEAELTSVTFYAEVICDAPMVNLLALFSESDLFNTWFPQVTGCQNFHSVTTHRGLYVVQQNMAWPVKPRDMIFSGSGVLDRKNRAVLTMLRTLEDDEMYFGVKTPKAAAGHVRLDVKRAYHYF